MTQQQQLLLRRILASPQFAQANSLQRILRYLCEHSNDKDPAALKEFQIAVNALGRPSNFDPKIDPIVRVSLGGIRERLRTYFQDQGSQETLRLQIPKGEYRVSFVPADAAGQAPPSRFSSLLKFWAPHISPDFANILVYTELLFFRDTAGNYLRNIFVNQLPEGMNEIRQKLPLDAMEPLRPSYHFLSAGEVYCTLSLMRAFQSIGASIELKNSRFCSWNELQRSNVVFLGSSRTNPFSDSLQSGENFVIGAERIENRAPASDERRSYSAKRHMEGKLERLTEYALVTRRPGLTPGTAYTLIAANHGRAIEGAGQFLSLEENMANLLSITGLGKGENVPEHFQLLLQVDMIDFDEEVIHVEYVAHRVLSGVPA